MIALKFPEINEILVWKDLFPSFNKISIIAVLAVLISSALFFMAGRKSDVNEAPKGSRNLAEIIVDFIEDGVIMQTMGKEGLAWTPFLLTLFLFIYLCNVPGIIPFFQMPATARMAVPMFLALLVWVVFNATGIKHQGVGGYFKSVLFPPGVPKALYILVTPIELISTMLVRPFSSRSSFVRQHACWSHSSCDLRIALRGFVPSERQDPHSRRHLAVHHARVPYVVRGARRVPSGVHFRHAGCGVHRRSGSPGALGHNKVSQPNHFT